MLPTTQADDVLRSVIAALAVSCVCTSALAQQPARVPAAAITGQVLAAGSDIPLRRARVEIARGSWRPEPALTDNEGRFSIDVDGTGPFALTATKGGYTIATTTVARADVDAPLLIRLSRGAAVAGRVVDLKGVPVRGMQVNARRLDPPVDGVPTQLSTQADDTGEYRLAGLSQGRYELVAGSPITLQRQSATPDALPGVNRVATVNLATGEEVSGVQLTTTVTSDEDFMLMLAERGVTQSSRAPVPGSAGRMRGRVLTATRTPVAGAVVRITGPGLNQSVRTDAAGTFSILGLRAGQYSVATFASGSMTWSYGQERAGEPGAPVTVPTDAVVEGIDIVLPRDLAVRGLIVDEHGEPLQGVRVQPMQLQFAAGRLIAAPVGVERRTDDRGNYRVSGLQPGSYIVAATVDGVMSAGSRTGTAYPRMYYPGALSVSAAQQIDLRDDAVADLVFAPTGLSEIRGTARDGDGPLVSGTARLVEARLSGFVASAPSSAAIQTDGTFVFRNVAPGNYVVQVRGDGAGRTGLFGTDDVTVGPDPVAITIKTSHGTTVEGHLVFEDPPEHTACNPSLLKTGEAVIANCVVGGVNGFQFGQVALDDHARADPTSVFAVGGTEFFTTGLFGRTSFALRRAPSADWYVKSLIVNGTDIIDSGFDFGAQPETISGAQLVLSRRGAVLTGRLASPANAPTGYFVVVFPVSRGTLPPVSRRVKFARSDNVGRFRIAGLPAGDYLVAAVSRLEGNSDAGEWQNPELLDQLDPGAERVTLSEGQGRTVALRLIQR